MQIKPQGMAMPSDPSTLPQAKYGPIYPKSPACHGFTIIAKVKQGREAAVRNYGKTIEMQWRLTLTALRRSSFITCVGCCSTSATDCTSYIKEFSTLTSTNTLKMQWPSS